MSMSLTEPELAGDFGSDVVVVGGYATDVVEGTRTGCSSPKSMSDFYAKKNNSNGDEDVILLFFFLVRTLFCSLSVIKNGLVPSAGSESNGLLIVFSLSDWVFCFCF